MLLTYGAHVILSRVLSLIVTLSILLTVSLVQAQNESIVRLDPQSLIYDIRFLAPVQKAEGLFTPIEFFIQDRVHGWSSKKTHLVLTPSKTTESSLNFDSTNHSDKGAFLAREFLSQGVEIPSKLIENFVKTRSFSDRNTLIRYGATVKSPLTIEKILQNFDDAEMNSTRVLRDILNRTSQILNDTSITKVLQDQTSQTSAEESDSNEIRGAVFNPLFLTEYYNERHILPPGTQASDFLTYAKPGQIHLRAAEEMRLVMSSDTQALRSIVKTTYADATQKLFNELMRNLRIDNRTLNSLEGPSKLSMLLSLTFQDLFWTIQSRTLLTKEQKTFLDLVYKMKSLQILGTAKLSVFFNSPERLSLTKDSFLEGLENQYERFMSSQSIERLSEGDIKARRLVLNSRISALKAKFNTLRCEMLF